MRNHAMALMTASALLLPAVSWAASPFTGTWQLVDGEYLDQYGKTLQYADMQMQSLKVLDEEHFSFTSMANGKFWSSGVGGYRYDDNVYVETPRYTSYEVPAGKSYQFRYRLQGDHWVNERWENGQRVEREVWQRVVSAASDG